jgi:hypothetical protein
VVAKRNPQVPPVLSKRFPPPLTVVQVLAAHERGRSVRSPPSLKKITSRGDPPDEADATVERKSKEGGVAGAVVPTSPIVANANAEALGIWKAIDWLSVAPAGVGVKTSQPAEPPPPLPNETGGAAEATAGAIAASASPKINPANNRVRRILYSP